ncbi:MULTISPECIES: hypothetical protein [Streptomyces]|uniref:Uncharacterized protein n=1 Tax=Streptomyces koelreuteriae TaxID=2838015 RepID=A0ABX8FVM2_9ACTN|nr:MULTISPECIES: hypothetical protein [Streptomyces]QWB25266.1 hypothetical protein KJK29_23350 [Streptomyces koelreuteriae]UUA08304.1 hypothetical protein NNW98_23495 [Streptomyces koelreuteriae]UUA15910.1 hypothetical protein NNW99_23380 [Streptomyces sp. CRCS-T-1]
MSDLTIPLPPHVRQELDDLADATGRLPEDIALDAVLHQLARESSPVRVAAESLAGAHADLLRRLGE